MIENWHGLACRSPAWLWLLVAAVIICAQPKPASAQLPCNLLSGPARSACTKESVRQQTAINRERAEAARAARQQSQPASAAAGPPPAGATAVGSPRRRDQPAWTGPYAEPPVIDRSVTPAMLLFVTHPSYSYTPGKMKLPINHRCSGASGNADLTFNKACVTQTLKGPEAAEPLFQQSCREGDPGGCFMYAELTESSDRATALAIYDQLCGLGHPDACYRVGLAYEKGDGAPKNAELQRSYYGRACTAGNDYGCRFIAGKIDPACPHGYRAYRANLDKQTYKAVCVTSTGPLTNAETDLPTTAAEVAMMKSQASHFNDKLPDWAIHLFDRNESPGGGGANSNCQMGPVDVNGVGGVVYGRVC